MPTLSSSTELPPQARAWIDAPEFATIATVEPDGRPHLSVVWVERDGDDLLVSTVVGRRKHRNLVRDPRATVLVSPREQPYSYVEVRGTASLTEEGGRELIDRLNLKYHGVDRYAGDDGTDNVRVVVRITPDKVVVRG
ncbi:MAG: PPOX class F420-dependent oxidoreductase [Candidatus Nanopelagicales bacterium]